MYSSAAAGLLATTFAASVSATGMLVPLYVYPSPTNWAPVYDSAANHPDLDILAVVNPYNGPGQTYLPGNNDSSYITGTATLNSYSNIKTIGYVRTAQATSPTTELYKNITVWADWATYTAADIHVDGIFFDECVDNYSYISAAIDYARNAFGSDITTICNFGAEAPADYYDICSVVIAFESFLANSEYPEYESTTTLNANIPSGDAAGAAVIVHDFTGTAYDGSTANTSLLSTYINAMKSFGLGWAYFCSGGYSSITTGPATLVQVADDLA